MNEALYIGITKPKEARKSLLEASKGAVQLLQTCERIKALRQERKEETEKLLKTFKEVAELAEEIKKGLPKVDIKKLPRTKPVKPQAVKPQLVKPQAQPKATKTKEEPKQGIELDTLDEELKEIEAKLKHL